MNGYFIKLAQKPSKKTSFVKFLNGQVLLDRFARSFNRKRKLCPSFKIRFNACISLKKNLNYTVCCF
jgi:hypothetical protein